MRQAGPLGGRLGGALGWSGYRPWGGGGLRAARPFSISSVCILKLHVLHAVCCMLRAVCYRYRRQENPTLGMPMDGGRTYCPSVLQDNWTEERRDAGYAPGKAARGCCRVFKLDRWLDFKRGQQHRWCRAPHR